MKIITIVRTRNEERNIRRFCESYTWVDEILVADGGSEDCTKEIASTFSNTRVRNFEERIVMKNGLWRNPEAEHINFLIAWALERDADWIIFDDCDCVPNKKLISSGKAFLESTPLDYVQVVRLYILGEDRWFPKLSKPGILGEWEPSLWAWRTSIDLSFVNSDFAFAPKFPIPIDKTYRIYPPYVLLHYAWPTEEEMMTKVNFYRNSGQIPGMTLPTEFGGSLEKLPEWAVCE